MTRLHPLASELSKLDILGKVKSLKQLSQGLSQASFWLDTEQGEFVAKSMADSPNTVNQQAMAKACAVENIAPEVIFSNKQWLIFKAIKGVTLEQKQFNRHQKLLAAMRLLAACHQVELALPEFNMQQAIDAVKPTKLDAEQQAIIERLFAPYLTLFFNNEVCCHGDLHFDNIMMSDEDNQLWLIDYEYSVKACAEYDIAMFMANQNFTMEQFGVITQLYQKFANKALSQALVQQLLPLCALLNACWYFNMLSAQADIFEQYIIPQLKLVEQYHPLKPTSLIEQLRPKER